MSGVLYAMDSDIERRIEEVGMSEPAIHYFCEQVEAVIARCRQEWDMSYCELIGTLEIIKAGLLEEALEDEGE